jgi:ATP-dependent helicase/nuclease subunit A
LTGRSDWHQEETGSGLLMDWRIRRVRPPFWVPPLAINAEAAPAPPALDTSSREIITQKLRWRYPWAAATREPAKSAVTRLSRSWQASEEAALDPAVSRHWTSSARAGSSDAMERGAAHHLFCELADLCALATREGLSSEAARLQEAGLLQPEQVALLDLDGLWVFWNSSLGHSIRAHARSVERELPFTARLTPPEAARLRGELPSAGFAPDDFQVIQGVIDLAVLLEDEIWIVDFKTDRVPEQEVDQRAGEYRFQLRLYAHALSAILERPVTQAWLYFVAARRAVPSLHDVTGAS